MHMTKSFLVATLSTGLILSPIMAQAQQVSKVTTLSSTTLSRAQETGGAAGAEAGASSGGMFGLSTMTMVGIGAALAAIVVVAVTTGSDGGTVCGGNISGNAQGISCPPPPPPGTTTTTTTTTTAPSTSTSTSTGTSTGT